MGALVPAGICMVARGINDLIQTRTEGYGEIVLGAGMAIVGGVGLRQDIRSRQEHVPAGPKNEKTDLARIKEINRTVDGFVNDLAAISHLVAQKKEPKLNELFLGGFNKILSNLKTINFNLHFPNETELDEGIRELLRDESKNECLLAPDLRDPGMSSVSLSLVRATERIVRQSGELRVETSGLGLNVPSAEIEHLNFLLNRLCYRVQQATEEKAGES
jgi:hypothetical protein